MWDAIGGLPLASADAFVAGGVGDIGAVLRIDEKKVVAVHTRPWDPEANGGLGAEIDLFLSTTPYTSFPTDTPASTRFEAVLERAYEFRASLFSGNEIGARSLPSLGNGIIDNRDDKRDFYQRLNFAGRDWRVFVGDDNAQFASFTEVWPGKAGSPELERDQIIVPLEDIGKRFDQPMQPNLYNPGFEPYVIFDGVDNQIDFTDVLDQGSTAFVFGVAFRTTTAQTSVLYGKGLAMGGANGSGYALGLGSGGALRAELGSGAATQVAATFTPSPGSEYNDGQRHTLVCHVERSTNTLRLRYDGAEVATADISGVGNTDNANSLFAGVNNAGGQRFVGEIERLALDNTLVGVQDALAERFADDVDASGLAHYVPLTENILFTANDVSPNGFHGTISGDASDDALWSGTHNGTPELQDVIIPQAFGQPFHVSPDLIDGEKLVYRFHSGSADAVLQVFDGGVELFEDTGATGDVFTGPGPAAGEWMVDLSQGLIRLGSPPEARITMTVRGDNSPSYTEEPSEILRRIATNNLGIPDPAGFDEQAFEDFIREQTGPGIELFPEPRAVAFYNSQTNPHSYSEAFDLLMRPRGWWQIGRTGLVTVGKLRHTTLPDSEIGDDDIVAGTLRRSAMPPVHWRDRTTYQRYWTVQTGGELLPEVTPRRRSLLSQEFRFVTGEDETLRDVFLDAVDATVETLIWIKDDALLELTDLRNLFGIKTEVWEMRLATGVLQYWLGDSVQFNLSTDRYNLSGRTFYVVGVEEDVYTGVRLTVWGPAE